MIMTSNHVQNPAQPMRAEGPKSEMAGEEGPSRAGLQISLEFDGSVFVSKSGGGADRPRSKFRCVWYFSGVVRRQSLLQVLGLPGVDLFGMADGLESIDVVELAHCGSVRRLDYLHAK